MICQLTPFASATVRARVFMSTRAIVPLMTFSPRAFGSSPARAARATVKMARAARVRIFFIKTSWSAFEAILPYPVGNRLGGRRVPAGLLGSESPRHEPLDALAGRAAFVEHCDHHLRDRRLHAGAGCDRRNRKAGSRSFRDLRHLDQDVGKASPPADLLPEVTIAGLPARRRQHQITHSREPVHRPHLAAERSNDAADLRKTA